MSRSVRRAQHTAAAVLIAFVWTVASPGAGVYVHRHAGGEHAHVHADEDAGVHDDHAGDHHFAEHHDADHDHHDHVARPRHHARLPGVRRSHPADTAHVHAQVPFQRAGGARPPSIGPRETVQPVAAAVLPAEPVRVASRPRSRGPPLPLG